MLRTLVVVAVAAFAACVSKPQRPIDNCWSTAPIAFDVGSEVIAQRSPWVEGDHLWFTARWDPMDYDLDLRLARLSDGHWSGFERPLLPDGSTFSTFYREDDPFLDDAGVMWMSSNTATEGDAAIVEASEKIYEAQTNDLTFEHRIPHPELGSRSSSLQPSLTPDRLTIYFSKDGNRISRATRQAASGPFAEPKELSAPHQVESPSIAADGETIFFTDHHDYTASQRGDADRIAMGHVVGDAIEDIELVGGFQSDDQLSYSDPHITKDGKMLAFTIDDGGASHIFYVENCRK